LLLFDVRDFLFLTINFSDRFILLLSGQLSEYFASVSHSLSIHGKTNNLTVPKLASTKLLIGNHGDILDILKIPSSPSSSSGELQFKVALVSNSHQLRILNEHLSCQILDGHQDIILSVDVSPDG
jgi:WD40 repeat protein